MVRWMRGEARIVVSEGFPALFLEKCRQRGIRLRYLIVRTGELEARVDQKDLNAVLEISALLGMHTQVLENRGIPQFLLRYRKRYGIPVGILIAAVILSVLSSFVWSVDFEGIERLDRQAFESYFKEAGLSQGVFLCNVDTRVLEQEAEAFDPNIKKVSVNLIGCRAFVRVWERVRPPEITDETICYDLVAAKDGEVVKADITAGTPMIHVGDGVLKGDILAQSAVPLKNGETRFAAASGIVIARTKQTVVCELRQKQRVATVVRHKKKTGLLFFGCEAPVHNTQNRENLRAMSCVSYLQAGGTAFPIGSRTTDLLYCSTAEITLTPAQALLICADDLARRSAELLPNCQVESREERLRTGETFSLEAAYTILENIAEQRQIELRPDT